MKSCPANRLQVSNLIINPCFKVQLGHLIEKAFLCHQHLCCMAYRDCFVISFRGVVGVSHRHTLYSGQYLKNGLSDLIQIWHVDVTAPEGVLYSLVTLNSH